MISWLVFFLHSGPSGRSATRRFMKGISRLHHLHIPSSHCSWMILTLPSHKRVKKVHQPKPASTKRWIPYLACIAKLNCDGVVSRRETLELCLIVNGNLSSTRRSSYHINDCVSRGSCIGWGLRCSSNEDRLRLPFYCQWYPSKFRWS